MTYLKHIASLLLALLVFSIDSVNATESITYIHTDHLGSPIAATNEDGSVKWTEDYQPFGVQRTNQDTDNTTGFTGHQHDDALELTYMQARWYHPEVGRFMALDPIVFRTSDISSFGRYTYAANNPYYYIDPDGRINYVAWEASRNTDDPWPMPDSSLSQEEAEFVVQAMAAAIDGPKEFVKSAVKESLGIEIPTPSLRKYVKKELKKARIKVKDVTNSGARENNFEVNMTKKQFDKHLTDSGFEQKNINTPKGTVSIFSKDGQKEFTTRNFSKSTNAPSGELFKKGKKEAKIRFKEK